jgi:dTDP-4-amino-4,6-dideoxygalactose transaminase
VISLVDLAVRHQLDAPSIEAAVLKVLRSGRWIGGQTVTDLEARVAQRMGWPHAVGVGNGTDALEICLQVLGVGPGDEVIVPAVTFFATAGAVCRVGAEPVIVDIRPDRPLIDWTQIERARSSRTRAVIPVHLFGMDAGSVDTDLEIIDDLAQAVGAQPPPGSGRLAALSFYPTKVLSGAGDGGMVLCRESIIEERVRMLGSHGVREGLHHRVEGSVGGNSRLDAIHAAVIDAQLEGLDQRLQRRREIYHRARAALGDAVSEHQEGSPISILCVRHPRRAALIAHLRSHGVAAGIYYSMPLSRQPALASCRTMGSLPNAEAFCAEALALPCHIGITDEQLDHILDCVGSFG